MAIDRHEQATALDGVHITSIIGFAFSELLSFKLLPRLKTIGSARLYRPGTGEDEAWPRLEAVLSNKTIDWTRSPVTTISQLLGM